MIPLNASLKSSFNAANYGSGLILIYFNQRIHVPLQKHLDDTWSNECFFTRLITVKCKTWRLDEGSKTA